MAKFTIVTKTISVYVIKIKKETILGHVVVTLLRHVFCVFNTLKHYDLLIHELSIERRCKLLNGYQLNWQ